MSEDARRIVLVYQAGIANVFEVDCFNMATYGRNAKRLLQSDFRSCEWFARGLGAAGCLVASAHCNMAGDIVNLPWSDNLEDAPFYDHMRPVWQGVKPWPLSYTDGQGWEVNYSECEEM